MSLRANIDHLAAAPGIVSVSVVTPSNPREFRGHDVWQPLLEAAVTLLDKTGEKTIRLVVGTHTVVLQTEGEETVGVVLPTGHAIAKSLRRMIRRMSRKVRPPLTRPEAAHLAPTSPPAPSAQPVAAPAPAPAAAPASESQSQPISPTWG